MQKRVYTSPHGWSIPFESEVDGRDNDFFSDNVQEAIEEARSRAFQNDRYSIPFNYTGNAGPGKWLFSFFGLDSQEAPFVFPEKSDLLTATLITDSPDTGVLGLFQFPDTVTPIYTFALNNERVKTFEIDPPLEFVGLDEIGAKVISGNLSKPAFRIWISSTIFVGLELP